MAIPDLVTWNFSAVEDSKYMDMDLTDPAIRSEQEGGWVVTRSRYTRKPTLIINTGYTDISNEDMVILRDFYKNKSGGSASFLYIHPTTGDNFTVRFKGSPKFKYAGYGPTRHWDVTFTLEEV